MANHGKKIIAPVVVTICLIVYYLAVIIGLYTIKMPDFIRIIITAVSVIVTVVLVFVMFDRIKEIKKGEEDDLGKY